jgi:hypothetical protein
VTQPIVQYCENCGKPLKSQARFCGRCGRAVTQQAPAPAEQQPYIPPPQQYTPPPEPQPVAPQPVATPQSTDVILTALPMGSQRSGFLGIRAEGFVLVLTNMRILFAQQTGDLLKENAQQAKENAKQSGKGFFGQWGAMLGSGSSQRYLQMQPQEILNETPGNYFVANNQIRSVRIKENYDPEGGRSETKLTLNTVSGKIELIYTQSSKRELKKALQQTLGKLVR